MEVEEGFKTALGDLGLVGSVLGVPTRVLHDVAEDDGRDEGAVVAHADEGLEELVLGGEVLHVRDHLGLGESGVELGEGHGRDADRLGDSGVDEGIEGGVAAELSHADLVLRSGRVVAAREGVGWLESFNGDEASLVTVAMSEMVGRDPGKGVVGEDGAGEGGDIARGGRERLWMAMAVGEEAAEETTAGDSPGTVHGPKLRAFQLKRWDFYQGTENRK